jgi:hypothetical protein
MCAPGAQISPGVIATTEYLLPPWIRATIRILSTLVSRKHVKLDTVVHSLSLLFTGKRSSKFLYLELIELCTYNSLEIYLRGEL